ncbi:MAG: hypothetical protein OET42_03820, partial [Deltaproteobacteria bacterium]|nr:hypothetical protein [Deltaproteobacteria bacterium]
GVCQLRETYSLPYSLSAECRFWDSVDWAMGLLLGLLMLPFLMLRQISLQFIVQVAYPENRPYADCQFHQVNGAEARSTS